MAFEQEGIMQIEYEELQKIVDKKESGSPYVIDVREREEYVENHIPGVPLIPMGEMIDLIDDFDPQQEYIFVCRSGRRSQQIAQFFKANGIENVKNYSGGMLEWEGLLKEGEERVITKASELYEKDDD